jgi:hypothetical protein
MPGNPVNPSTLVSTVRYLQNIGLTLGIRSEDLGADLERFALGLANFLNRVFEYLPYFPNLDIRVRLVAITFMIPVMLNFVFVWYTRSTLENLIYVGGLIGFFCFFYEIGYLSLSDGHGTVHTGILFPLSAILLGLMIYDEIKAWRKRRNIADDVRPIIDVVKDHFLSRVLPDVHTPLESEDVNEYLDSKIDSHDFNEVRPTVINVSLIFVFIAALAIIIWWAIGWESSEADHANIALEWGVACVCFVFILILIFALVMLCVPCLHPYFDPVFSRLRRFTLKFILVVLDCLYVPICSAIIDLLTVDHNSCEVGSYFFWEPAGQTLFSSLMDVNVSCQPCNDSLVDACAEVCSGAARWFSDSSPHLELDNMMKSTGPLLAVSILFFVVGQPIFWLFLIIQNRDIAWSIPAYGDTTEQKWGTLTEKLVTPGVFLFAPYRLHAWFWGLVIQVSKVLIVVMVHVSRLVSPPAAYGLLLLYLGIFVAYLMMEPYAYFFNNVFDSIMAFANMAMTLVPICAYHGKVVPRWFEVPLAVIVFLVPLVAIPYTLFRRRSSEPALEPGMAIDEDGHVVPSIVEDQELAVDVKQLIAIWQLMESEKGTIYPSSGNFDDFAVIEEAPVIRVDVLKATLDEMYKTIDCVTDAVTTGKISRVLRAVAAVLTACGGWFFGAVSGQLYLSSTLYC